MQANKTKQVLKLHNLKSNYDQNREQTLLSNNKLLFLQLQILFTLFTKFFSSFLHSTCLLSLLAEYFEFDEVYQHFTVHYKEL